jgi:N-acetylmuramoyl-L-alanine amidase
MKIAIIVGHNSRAQGAVRVTDGRTEFDWNGDLAKMIEDINPERVKVFHRTPGGGYSAQIKRVYQQVDAWGADVSLELHFNAAGPGAHGCETLSSGTSGSLALAERVQAAIVADLPVRDRGIKLRPYGQGRGWLSLWAGRAPAALLEPYFGSSSAECQMADDWKEVLAEAIYEAAAEHCSAMQGAS